MKNFLIQKKNTAQLWVVKSQNFCEDPGYVFDASISFDYNLETNIQCFFQTKKKTVKKWIAKTGIEWNVRNGVQERNGMLEMLCKVLYFWTFKIEPETNMFAIIIADINMFNAGSSWIFHKFDTTALQTSLLQVLWSALTSFISEINLPDSK